MALIDTFFEDTFFNQTFLADANKYSVLRKLFKKPKMNKTGQDELNVKLSDTLRQVFQADPRTEGLAGKVLKYNDAPVDQRSYRKFKLPRWLSVKHAIQYVKNMKMARDIENNMKKTQEIQEERKKQHSALVRLDEPIELVKGISLYFNGKTFDVMRTDVARDRHKKTAVFESRLISEIKSWSVSLNFDVDSAGGYIKDLTREGVHPNPGPRRKTGQMVKRRNRNRRRQQPFSRVGRSPVSNTPGQQNMQRKVMTRKIVYQEPSNPYNNPGGPVTADQFQTTDPQDIKPSILTPETYYYTYGMQLYHFCIVESVLFEQWIDNLEQFPLDYNLFASANNLTPLLASRTTIANASNTASCLRSGVLTEQYGKKSQLYIRCMIIPWQVVGDKTVYYSGDFACTLSSGPARLVNLAWSVSSAGSSLINGVTSRIRITLKCRFYQAEVLTAAPSLARRVEELEESSESDKVDVKKCTDVCDTLCLKCNTSYVSTSSHQCRK